jgi:single-stranded-DNA-specific exonuclease
VVFLKYELNIKSNNEYTVTEEDIKNNILKAREIHNVHEYCNTNKSHEHDYKLLKNIDKAIKCYLEHINKGSKIATIVDEDTDGNTSSAILYNYSYRAFENINLIYLLHTKKKAHGLSEEIMEQILSDDKIKLVILPDAGSNDYEQHKILKNKGIDIICLDHHEADKISENAIIVNNQLCDYPNKSLSGVGIVYKFLQGLDEELWLNYSNEYIDMVMLGLIADNMNVRDLETKYYIDLGLKNIKNKQLKALIDKKDFDIKGVLNMINIAFYIAPLINGMIRCGTYDDKELMFKGFIQQTEEFDYKPRGKDETIKESIYDRVARLCANTKARQDKSRNKAFEEVDNEIVKRNKINDKILIVNCNDKFDSALSGVVAIKIADKYNKPVLLLRKHSEDIYGGSGRNTDRNSIKDLKFFVNESGLFEFGNGHPQAFGVSIHKKNINKFIEYANEKLKDVEFDGNNFTVDYIIPFEELSDDLIFCIDSMKNLWGKDVNESLIAVENIEVQNNEIQILGKTSNTLKFTADGVDFIKFFIKEDEELVKRSSDWESENKVFTINVVGKCSSNIWNKEKKPQIIISDYQIISESDI